MIASTVPAHEADPGIQRKREQEKAFTAPASAKASAARRRASCEGADGGLSFIIVPVVAIANRSGEMTSTWHDPR